MTSAEAEFVTVDPRRELVHAPLRSAIATAVRAMRSRVMRVPYERQRGR
jgi:hypothetical protein